MPENWSNAQEITFNYTDFEDTDSGIAYYAFEITRVENSTSNDTFRVANTGEGVVSTHFEVDITDAVDFSVCLPS